MSFVGATGFEPATSCSQSKRASRTAPRPVSRSVSIMRGMRTRQATKWTIILLALLTFITGCSQSEQPVPTSTPFSPTATLQINDPLPTSTNTPTPTQPSCLSQPGRVDSGKVETTKPPQEYLIYLPHCYDEQPDKQYPVLYLLHGQTYTADQ